MQCLSCRRFKDLFCSFSPSPTNLLPVSLPVEVRGGCKKFQLRRQRLSHLAAVQNSIACFQKPVCLPAGRVCKGHATLRPCLGERERERERERDGEKLRTTAQPFPLCLTWQSSFLQYRVESRSDPVCLLWDRSEHLFMCVRCTPPSALTVSCTCHLVN